ncbi:response regulator with CheY-like receiver domain and winged-helix DNA-binding domain, partial [Caulobacter sp. AP07]|uniref:response regulator n=1 Tax=Caulobacter sp. AP07 TaxID=1144304 RepID=UPI000271F2AE
MNELVLIAEDDRDIADILDGYLTREGFRTVCAGDGQVAVDLYGMLRPDVVILDVTMPKLDGWKVLTEIRRRGSTPVVMVTALDQDVDKIHALRNGADDYVVKPFNPVEVVARVQALLRRASASRSDRLLRVGPLRIDPQDYLAVIATPDGERSLDLTLTEFRLLAHMARQPSRVFTRADLLDACLPGDDVLERTVDSHLSKLRRKLESAGVTTLLGGVRGVGYRLG